MCAYDLFVDVICSSLFPAELNALLRSIEPAMASALLPRISTALRDTGLRKNFDQ